MGVRAFLDAFGRYIATGEIMDIDRQRESQGDAEHGPLPCVDADCNREDCVTYRTRALLALRKGLTDCTVCHLPISNAARLDCGSCAN